MSTINNYNNTMITNTVMNKLEEKLRKDIISRIEHFNFFILSDGNVKLFESWINKLNLNELVNLKSCGDYFGYHYLATIINDTISEYNENITN